MKFQRLELKHINELRPFFESNECRICDCTIGGTFMWRDYFKTEFAVEDDILYLRADYFDDGVAFPPPRGEHQGEPYEKLIEHCRAEGMPLRLCAVSQRNLERILALYPDAKVRTDRAWSDYLYNSADLAELAGRKYSAQRNHINKFKRDNPDFTFEKLSAGDLSEVREFFERSFDERQKDSPTYNEGNLKTIEVIDNFELYGLVGGALRVRGEMIGATLGEVSGDTLYVHTERSDVNIPGSYQMLTNMFARAFVDERVKFINREEDDGDEGLRKAKLAYHPSELLDKYFVEL